MASAASTVIDHKIFCNEIKYRLIQAGLLTKYLNANKPRIEAVLDKKIAKKLGSLAHFICGWSFDLSKIKPLDANAMGILKAFHKKKLESDYTDLGPTHCFFSGVITKIDNLKVEDTLVPNIAPAVTDYKVALTMSGHDEKVCGPIGDYMDNLYESNAYMHRALLDVCIKDKEFDSVFNSTSDDELADFGMYLLGSGVTVENLKVYSKDTKDQTVKRLVKYQEKGCKEGINALIAGIKASS
jgi:hypothetical protein